MRIRAHQKTQAKTVNNWSESIKFLEFSTHFILSGMSNGSDNKVNLFTPWNDMHKKIVMTFAKKCLH